MLYFIKQKPKIIHVGIHIHSLHFNLSFTDIFWYLLCSVHTSESCEVSSVTVNCNVRPTPTSNVKKNKERKRSHATT